MFFAKVVVDSVLGSRQTGSAGGFDNNHDMFNKNNKNEVCPAQSLDEIVRVMLAVTAGPRVKINLNTRMVSAG